MTVHGESIDSKSTNRNTHQKNEQATGKNVTMRGLTPFALAPFALVSKSLKSTVTAVEIERRGMPKRATEITETRFPGVGQSNPKSSDHCPLLVELDL